MMKNKKLCLVLDLRMPHFLRDFTLLEIGKEREYYDLDRTQESFRERYERVIRPLFDSIQELSKPDNPLKLSVFFSGNFLNLLNDHFPKEVERITAMIKEGNLQVLGGSYSNTLASLFSLDVFSIDIERHQEILSTVLGVSAEVFINTENIYSNNIAKRLSDHNFKATFSDHLPWYLNGQHPRQIFKAPLKKDFRVMIMEHSGKLLADDKQDQWKFVKMVPYSQTQGQDWLERLKTITMGHKTSTIDEALKTSKPKHVFSAPSPIGGLGRTNGLDEIIHNPMQKKALETIFSLENDVLKSGDKKLISDWIGLSNVEYLMGMNPDWVEGSRPYDIFIRYMNILTDIKLRLT